jgi:hypothetical protein
MNQLWDVGNIRDYWSQWTPAAVQNLSWLNAVDCFRPKLFVGPNEGDFNIPESGYIIITFPLVPGSWLVGLSEVNASSLDFQITDLTTNYQFFASPISATLMQPAGNFVPPFWLPEPYMFQAPALLRLEIWNNTLVATAQSQILLHILEPVEV